MALRLLEKVAAKQELLKVARGRPTWKFTHSCLASLLVHGVAIKCWWLIIVEAALLDFSLKFEAPLNLLSLLLSQNTIV